MAKNLKSLIAVLLITSVTLFIGCSKDTPRPEEPPLFFEHVVKYQGETYSAIAAWYTGSSNNWQEIARANKEIKPTRIVPGMKIKIPQRLLVRETRMPEKAVPKKSVLPTDSWTAGSTTVAAPPIEGEPAPVKTDLPAVDVPPPAQVETQAASAKDEVEEFVVPDATKAPEIGGSLNQGVSSSVAESKVETVPEKAVEVTPQAQIPAPSQSSSAAAVAPLIESGNTPQPSPQDAIQKSRDELLRELLNG